MFSCCPCDAYAIIVLRCVDFVLLTLCYYCLAHVEFIGCCHSDIIVIRCLRYVLLLLCCYCNMLFLIEYCYYYCIVVFAV